MSDRTNFCPSCKGYADRIAALEARLAKDKKLFEDIARVSDGWIKYDCDLAVWEIARL